MDLEVVGTLNFVFITKSIILGKQQCQRHEHVWGFPLNYAIHMFSQPHQRSSDFYITSIF